MNEELLATYYYESSLEDGDSVFEVVAYYDSTEHYINGLAHYYYIFDKSGKCMNKEKPLTAMPTWDFVRSHFYNQPSKKLKKIVGS